MTYRTSTHAPDWRHAADGDFEGSPLARVVFVIMMSALAIVSVVCLLGIGFAPGEYKIVFTILFVWLTVVAGQGISIAHFMWTGRVL